MEDGKKPDIVIEVEQDKPGLEWLEQRGAAFNPTQRDTDPIPTIYISVIEKYAKVKVQGIDVQSVVARWT